MTSLLSRHRLRWPFLAPEPPSTLSTTLSTTPEPSATPPEPCDGCRNAQFGRLLRCMACRDDARRGDGWTMFRARG